MPSRLSATDSRSSSFGLSGNEDAMRSQLQSTGALPERNPPAEINQQGTPTDIPSIPNVHLEFLDDVYFIGPVLSSLNLMIWLALILIVVSWLVMFKTPIGLRIRSVGEHPRAADTVGIDVYAVRYGAVTLSGILAAADKAGVPATVIGETGGAGREKLSLLQVLDKAVTLTHWSLHRMCKKPDKANCPNAQPLHQL